MKVLHGQYKGLYHKKPTTMTVSCAELGRPFTNLLCDGSHQHLQGDGHPKELAESQTWTWTESRKICDGIAEVRARRKRGYSLYEVYAVFDATKVAPANTTEQPKRGNDHRAPPKKDSPCSGCKHMRPRNDWTHNRIIGECSHPFDAPFVPKCEACQMRVGRWKSVIKDGKVYSHSGIVGECKWGTASVRQSAPRLGQHPRDPRRRASDDITAGLPGTSPDGELGADDGALE